ncbi:F-box protein PP2-A14 [Hibiscus syriacus]|uniref:F-box protein PP2-A14 n=1 Tax=Hibiscus syriacus TaxID=106335 RepID=A0A6A3B246_HIBSY|nr:F-box protein PP2-A14 [Hibiscus syriacus]
MILFNCTCVFFVMGAGVSGLAAAHSQFKTGLDDVTENCISSIYMHLNPPEICRLAALNRAFRGASSVDFVWEKKLPSNYRYLVEKIVGQGTPDTLSKKETFARLCRPNRLDGGTKIGELCLSVSAKALKITGINDRRYRNHIPTEDPRQTLEKIQSTGVQHQSSSWVEHEASSVPTLDFDGPTSIVRWLPV